MILRKGIKGKLPVSLRLLFARRTEEKRTLRYCNLAVQTPNHANAFPFGCYPLRQRSAIHRPRAVHRSLRRKILLWLSENLCSDILCPFPLVKDIVVSECQFRLTLRLFLLINLTDKAVVNLYFLFTKAAIVLNRFMDHNFLNHVIQQFCGQFRRF